MALAFTTLTGSKKKINYLKYRVDWNSKCRSQFQKRIKDFFSQEWKHDVVCEEFPIAGTRLTFDLYNVSQKIAVEVQGAQHLKYIEFFHGKNKNGFLNQLDRDSEKERFCVINGIDLIEIYPQDEPLSKEKLEEIIARCK